MDETRQPAHITVQDRIEHAKAKDARASLGKAEMLSWSEYYDCSKLWMAALSEVGYEPVGESSKHDFEMYASIGGMAREQENAFVKAAISGGVEYLLDAYFTGVPVEDILA